MLRLTIPHGYEREVDLSRWSPRKLNLRLLCCFTNPAHSLEILLQIYSSRLLELGNNPFHYSLIEIVTTESVVSAGCLDLNLWLTIDLVNLQDGDIECPSAQIVNEYGLILLLVYSIG